MAGSSPSEASPSFILPPRTGQIDNGFLFPSWKQSPLSNQKLREVLKVKGKPPTPSAAAFPHCPRRTQALGTVSDVGEIRGPQYVRGDAAKVLISFKYWASLPNPLLSSVVRFFAKCFPYILALLIITGEG